MIAERLLTLFSRYIPGDAREAEFAKRMQVLLSGPAPFDRTLYQPGHFTASAFVLSPENDSVLLVLHKKLGLWLQPGGHIEPTDSSVVQAAEREVAEEVGLSGLELIEPHAPILDLDIHSIPPRPSEPAHQHFDVRFAFRAPSRAVHPNHEVQNPLWAPLDRVSTITTDWSVLRVVQKLQARRTFSRGRGFQ